MIKVNLIGQNHRREVARKRVRFCFAVMLGAVVCASAGYAALVERSLEALRRESQAVQERSQHMQSMRKKIVALQDQRKAMLPRLSALQDIVGKRQLFTELFKALSVTIPDEAWLLEARVADGQLELVGLSPSELASTAFVSKLRATKLFSDVTVAKVMLRERSDSSMQEFQLRATFAPVVLPDVVSTGAAAKAEEPA